MRLSVDGFARFFSRKALFATAAVGAVALVALGAFSWKSNQPAAAPCRAGRPPGAGRDDRFPHRTCTA